MAILYEAKLNWASWLRLLPLNTNPHHLAAAYCLQFRHADFCPRRFEFVEQYLGDVFGQRFQQAEVATGEFALDAAHDVGVVQRVVNVVGLAGKAAGQGDLQVDLQGLRNTLLPFVYADECVDLEFAQKYDVHKGLDEWLVVMTAFE
ncbi:MAG: hypothetical protein FD173_2351 [Gallionellaceae bacterium]|nr:MAG: hypothetical protein FD173_2351 [Gallionellaceae bacterium]